jgi:rhodanese-related sulfurtransferase
MVPHFTTLATPSRYHWHRTIDCALMLIVPLTLASTRAAFAGPVSTAEATSKTAECYSGVSCLAQAGLLLKQPIDVVELLAAAQMSSTASDASRELVRLAMRQGFHAFFLSQVSTQDIARCTYPIILHVKGGLYSKHPDDFVLCTLDRDRKVDLFITPARALSIPLSQLEDGRIGEGVVLSRDPFPGDVPFPGHLFPIAKIILMLVVLGCLSALLIARRRKILRRGAADRVAGLRGSCFQLLAIFAASPVLTIVGQRVAGQPIVPDFPSPPDHPLDFLMSEPAEAAGALVKPTDISIETALRWVDGAALFVDARDFSEYDAGHIRGAICCPADDIARWRLHLAGVDLHRRIVCYCAQASCHKGEYLATFLVNNGFSDVHLFRDGWARWTGPKEGR